MKTFKLFVAIVLWAVMFLPFNIVRAEIDGDRIALGGMNCDMTLDEIIAMYGEPVSVQGYEGSAKHYYWPHFHVWTEYTHWPSEEYIYAIETGLNPKEIEKIQSLTTPDGIYIGMDESIIEEVYGAPDHFTKIDSNHNFNTYSYMLVGTESLREAVRNNDPEATNRFINSFRYSISFKTKYGKIQQIAIYKN